MSTPVMKLFDLHDQLALVTGGSRGLGLQIAEALGEAGARIMLTSRKANDLDEAVAHLRDLGIDASWIAADASDPDQVRKVCGETLERLGPVDILVNNAGAAWGAPAEDHPLDAWDKVMDLNVRGVFVFSQTIGRASMIPRRRGRIINVASIAGLHSSVRGPHYAGYAATKAGLMGLTRELAASWGHEGIRVNAIAPGFFHSRLADPAIPLAEPSIKASCPIPRVGAAGELKGVAVFLASDASNYITGQVIVVDGGRTIAGH